MRPASTLAMAATAALLVAFGAAPAYPASAADTFARVMSGELEYKAAPGQVNHVTFTAPDADTYLVDDIVPITPLNGCAHPDPADPTLVECTAAATFSGQLIIDVGDLDDIVNPTGPNHALIGLGAGNDVAYGYPGSVGSLVSGGTGNDVIHSGPGRHTIDGGSGTDTVSYAARTAAVTVKLAACPCGEPGENDGLPGIENVTGGSGNDRLEGTAAANVLSGGAGEDTIMGWDGDDSVYGGIGNDFVSGVKGNDTVSGGSGDDEVFGDWDNDILYGDAGHDTVYGGPGANTVTGGSGNDTLYGGPLTDTLNGGTGNDTMEAGAGNDTLRGSYGTDHLDGGTGAADDCDGGPDPDTETNCEI
ncbi:calcium-binding protein [Nonomuraea sp. NPDC050394]|uniref:calcium-binding protein n=1 Tax=Nonomuraea sp. NPDC050394 TaxID=3364363 RepID=UPI003793931A